MHSLRQLLLLATLFLGLAALASADLTKRASPYGLEKRNKHSSNHDPTHHGHQGKGKSGKGQASSGGASGPVKGPLDDGGVGNLTSRCAKPKFEMWTIELDAVKPGCYEAGSHFNLTWKVVETGDPYLAVPSPTLQTVMFSPDTAKGDFWTNPIQPGIFGSNGEPACAQICAVDEFAPSVFPNVEQMDDLIFPTYQLPWGVTMLTWSTRLKTASIVLIQEVPDRDALNADNGFFIAAPGGCKNFVKPKPKTHG